MGCAQFTLLDSFQQCWQQMTTEQKLTFSPLTMHTFECTAGVRTKIHKLEQIFHSVALTPSVTKQKQTVYLLQLPTFPSVMSGSPDFFKNRAASVGPTLPVLPGSTLEQTHTSQSECTRVYLQL